MISPIAREQLVVSIDRIRSIAMAELLPTSMIQGEKVWLREMVKRDLETFARNRNDLEIGNDGQVN